MKPTAVLFHGDSVTLLKDGLRASQARTTIGDIPARMKGIGLLQADAGVTDPPYGFDFAGEDSWDTFKDGRSFATAADNSEAFAKFTKEWSYGLRVNVLRFGSHLLCFTASRTIGPVDRGLQVAGYAIPRVLFWLYASGQVKSQTDLRPGCEPIFVGRVITDRNGKVVTEKGLKDLFAKEGLGQLHAPTWKEEDGRHPTDMLIDEELIAMDEDLARKMAEDPGTFFISKPSPKERDLYCGDLPLVQKDSNLSHMSTSNVEKRTSKHKDDGTREPVMAQNYHPTVKSIQLMRRLVRLVSRPGHVIVDPFMGSGTTGIAAMLEGRHFIGIEREEKYFHISSTRIANAREEAPELA